MGPVPTLPAPDAVGDAVLRAVVLLAALVLARLVLAVLLRAALLAPGAVGRTARGALRAVRPGLARRVLAVVVGLGAPALGALAPGNATPSAAAADPVRSPAAPGRSGAAEAPATVVVVPGDTLWDIARRHLPVGATRADVARAWPRWYAANRAVIGPDPDLIRPGTRLRVPDRRPTGTSAPSHDRPSAAGADAGPTARSLDPDRR